MLFIKKKKKVITLIDPSDTDILLLYMGDEVTSMGFVENLYCVGWVVYVKKLVDVSPILHFQHQWI